MLELCSLLPQGGELVSVDDPSSGEYRLHGGNRCRHSFLEGGILRIEPVLCGKAFQKRVEVVCKIIVTHYVCKPYFKYRVKCIESQCIDRNFRKILC